MNESQPMKEVVTVAEMARMCNLSRSRFYMLIADGIMPLPSRNPEGRPFYSREQQETCLRVRKTNCGANGKPVLFSCMRFRPMPDLRPSGRKHGKKAPRPPSPQADPMIDEVIHGLQQLGMSGATAAQVNTVLASLYPDGYGTLPVATLLAEVFRRLQRRD